MLRGATVVLMIIVVMMSMALLGGGTAFADNEVHALVFTCTNSTMGETINFVTPRERPSLESQGYTCRPMKKPA